MHAAFIHRPVKDLLLNVQILSVHYGIMEVDHNYCTCTVVNGGNIECEK